MKTYPTANHYRVLALLPSVYHSRKRVGIYCRLKLLVVDVGINLSGIQRFVTQNLF